MNHKTVMVIALFLFTLPLPAMANEDQEPLLKELRQGDLYGALRLAKISRIRLSREKAIEAAQLLHQLATNAKPGKYSTRRITTALNLALDFLAPRFPMELQTKQLSLTSKIGLDLGRMLMSSEPVPSSKKHTQARHALEKARQAACTLLAPPFPKPVKPSVQNPEISACLKQINLLLIPINKQIKRFGTTIQLCQEVLAINLNLKEKKFVNEALGLSLLALGRIDKALPFLSDYLLENPTDPEAIGPIADSLDRKDPQKALGLLLPVIQSDPEKNKREAWTTCLDLLYNQIVKRLPPRKPPLSGIIKSNYFICPVPKVWGYSTWTSGYRQYRDPYTRAGKTYEGKDAISAFIPLSHGWSRTSSAPSDLRRWNNVAFCMTRGSNKTTLVCYWFAPDLQYWYGHTPQTRGVTGKSAKGHSKGAIFSLVSQACYGKEARARGQRFKRGRSTGLTVPGTGVKTHTWQLGNNIYCENFFSIGQVTVEVLLRIQEKDLKLLAPELIWMFKQIRVR